MESSSKNEFCQENVPKISIKKIKQKKKKKNFLNSAKKNPGKGQGLRKVIASTAQQLY